MHPKLSINPELQDKVYYTRKNCYYCINNKLHYFLFSKVYQKKTTESPKSLSDQILNFWNFVREIFWVNPIRCKIWETEISLELSETPCCYREVGPISKLCSHEKNQVQISKTGWDFEIWKFHKNEISPRLDSRKFT